MDRTGELLEKAARPCPSQPAGTLAGEEARDLKKCPSLTFLPTIFCWRSPWAEPNPDMNQEDQPPRKEEEASKWVGRGKWNQSSTLPVLAFAHFPT